MSERAKRGREKSGDESVAGQARRIGQLGRAARAWTSGILQARQSETAEIIVGPAEDGRKFLQAQVCPWDFSHLRQSTATPSGLPPKAALVCCEVSRSITKPSNAAPNFFSFPSLSQWYGEKSSDRPKVKMPSEAGHRREFAPSPLRRPGRSLPAPWRCAAGGLLPRDSFIHKYSS